MPQKIPAWIAGSYATNVAAALMPLSECLKFALLGYPLPPSFVEPASLLRFKMAAKLATAIAHAAYALHYDMQDTVFIGENAAELQMLAQWLVQTPQAANTEVFSDALVKLAHDTADWFMKAGLPDHDAEVITQMLGDLAKDIAVKHWKRPFGQFNMLTHSVLTVSQVQQMHNLKEQFQNLLRNIQCQQKKAYGG